MRFHKLLCLLQALSAWAGCMITLTPLVSSSELDTTERGAFIDDGRFS
jgi:hypothetical protein